jgi:predicted RNase H-like nuclease (RuvC/YqgF family)
VYKQFKILIDEKYAAIKLDESEREKIQYQSKIDTLLLSPERAKLLARERADLRKQIEQLTKEIALLENNLGFFAKSKGADQLRLEVEKKVKFAQDKITTIKRKLSMLPNE